MQAALTVVFEHVFTLAHFPLAPAVHEALIA